MTTAQSWPYASVRSVRGVARGGDAGRRRLVATCRRGRDHHRLGALAANRTNGSAARARGDSTAAVAAVAAATAATRRRRATVARLRLAARAAVAGVRLVAVTVAVGGGDRLGLALLGVRLRRVARRL